MNVTGALSAIARARSRPDERRNNGRFGVEDLKSNAGPVIDLSGRGARIVSKFRWEEGERRDLTLKGASMSVTVHTRCVWVRKEGWRRYVIGLAFEECTNEQRVVLAELARRYTTRTWGKPFQAATDEDATIIPLAAPPEPKSESGEETQPADHPAAPKAESNGQAPVTRTPAAQAPRADAA